MQLEAPEFYPPSSAQRQVDSDQFKEYLYSKNVQKNACI